MAFVFFHHHFSIDAKNYFGKKAKCHFKVCNNYWMALRGIQEYIARDANNIVSNIVSIEGNIFLYPPKKSHRILLLSFV